MPKIVKECKHCGCLFTCSMNTAECIFRRNCTCNMCYFNGDATLDDGCSVVIIKSGKRKECYKLGDENS